MADAPSLHKPPGFKVPPDKVAVYGKLYPKGVTKIATELDAYYCGTTVEQHGLGKEVHFRNAWKLLWPKFEMNEWVDMMIWAWCNYKYITVIGHQRGGKTYNFAHVAYLHQLAGPMDTMTSIATVTFDGLRLRMWSDMLRAAETAIETFGFTPFTIRSTTNECRIFLTDSHGKDGEKFQIHGMSVSRTADAPGRIRGGHAPRRVIILDEAQDMPPAIFDAMVNPMSAPDGKCVLLSNPVERVSKFGEWCEPKNGWSSVNETDLWWETKRGNGMGICLHLDGLQSPNLRAGKTVFPYLLTQQSVDEVISAHGKDSVQYWALVRGFFPPDGMVSKVFPSSTIERGRPEIKFDFQPGWCATLDPAFDYDNAVLHFGQIGAPVYGERFLKINAKESVVFKYDASLSAEPKDYQLAHFVMSECQRRGVPPAHFIMDTTGNARGTYAILQKEWSRDVQAVNYGGAATDRPLRADDNRKCNEIYQYYVSELWFRASECMKAGLIGGLDNLDQRTLEDLSARRYELKQSTKGRLMMVESKDEMKKRIGRSPDFGDAFVHWGELLYRLGTAPGGGIALKLQASSMWAKQKTRAQRVNSRQSEDLAYTY